MRAGIPSRDARLARFLSALPALACSLLLASAAAAAPTIGFRGTFPGTSLDGWSSGDAISNPGTDGVRGAGDGYLLITVPPPFASNLGAFGATPDYAGNWTTAGITQIRLWLNDVNDQDSLEIHLAIGNGLSGNFWQFNTGFIPPHDQWAPFTVDLTTAANFSFIGTGTGNFATALQDVDRILVRHDKAPYVKAPNAAVGDVGVDEILLTNGIAGVGGPERLASGQPVRLAPPAPNPSRGAVTFRMDASETAPVRIQIVDAMGRVIRHAELPAAAPGSRSWLWDGADDHGGVVAAGYYRVRAVGPSGGMSQPLVRVQ